MRAALTAASLLLAAAAPAGRAAWAQGPVAGGVPARVEGGFVLRVRGGWFVTGGPGGAERVGWGRVLYEGDSVSAAGSGAPGDSIVIAFRDGATMTRACVPARRPRLPCGPPIAVRVAEDTGGRARARRVFAAVMRRASERPERFRALVSRGGGAAASGGPREAVVRLAGHRLDLGPAFPGGGATAPSRYTLLPIGEPSTTAGRAAAASAGPVTLVADRAGGQLARAPTLAPGLYELSVPEPGGTAWVLVAAAAGYEAAAASFAEAVGITEGWDRSVPAGDVRAFLRIYLDALAGGARR